MTKEVYSIRIDGPFDPKGSMADVSCGLTATGIEWTITALCIKRTKRAS